MESAEHVIAHAGGAEVVSVLRETGGGDTAHVYEIREGVRVVAELASLSEVARYINAVESNP
jgi:hypothetical protein